MAFLSEERAQDLTEYALILAFVCLASAGLFLTNFESLAGIWTTTNQEISIANSLAQGS
jgi:Flp pilus assembly pilin Flp